MVLSKKLVTLLAAAVMALSPISALSSVSEPVYVSAEGSAAASEDHSELLTLCKGSYAYNELGKLENGSNYQKFYNKLFDIYSKVWTDGKDYSYFSNTTMYIVDGLKLSDYGMSSMNEAAMCYYGFRYDNPVMYYLPNTYAQNTTTFYARLYDEYVKAADRKALQQDIYDYVAEMTAPAAGYTRRFEKALILHDKILPLMEYNYDDKSATYSHNIIGAVEYQKGVCECYAKTYQMLLNYVGIDNFLVIGTELENNEGHAWNAVKMDNGAYYFFDVTWDDKSETHRFFAKGYTVFDEKHAIREANTNSSTYFYPMPSSIPDTDYSCQANNPTLYNQMQSFSFYINKDNTIAVRKYLGSSAKVNIPSEILGLKVGELTMDAFWGNQAVEEVNLSETVASIGKGAFFASLSKGGRKVTIPKSVTSIGDYALGYAASVGGTYKNDGDYTPFSPVKISGFTIYCYKNSAAYKYAVNNGFAYVLLDDEEETLAGDADGNGSVSVSDVLIIQQYLANWNVKIDELAADVNADGKVTVSDVLLLQQYLAHWNVTLKTAA